VRRNKCIIIILVSLIALIVSGCLPGFIKSSFSVGLTGYPVRFIESDPFEIGLTLDNSYPFRVAAFELKVSEGLSLVDVSISDTYVHSPLEVFWGKSCEDLYYVHLAFLYETNTKALSGTLIEMQFIAEKDSSLVLKSVRFVDDNLQDRHAQVKARSKVFIRSVGR